MADYWKPNTTVAAVVERDGRLLIGVRPEHARLVGDGGWPMRVEMLEMLGAERLVHGHVGDSAFTLRIDATLPPPRAGEVVQLAVPPEHLHGFDVETGRRI